MSPQDLSTLQSAFSQWFAESIHDEPCVAATLTFRPWLRHSNPHRFEKLSLASAQSAVRYFLRRLDRAAFRRGAVRRGHRVQAISVVEGGEGWMSKHIHYHLLIVVPSHLTADRWLQIIERELGHVEWASSDQNVFRQVFDGGWLDYMLKLRDKPSFVDAIDLENLRIN